MADYRILPVGDAAVTVDFGNEISPHLNSRVHSLQALIQKSGIIGITEMIPTFRSLMICYDPYKISYNSLCAQIDELAEQDGSETSYKATVYLIPVCYGGKYGEDLEDVAKINGLTEDEVIRIHSAPDYLIYMLGFLPGFSYLGGLDPRIVTPRLETPRSIIPAGSVGIGGAQTGIYPVESPGGWRLIGRTPIKPFDQKRERPILYNAGDYIRFYPVDEKEYLDIEEQIKAGEYLYITGERRGTR